MVGRGAGRARWSASSGTTPRARPLSGAAGARDEQRPELDAHAPGRARLVRRCLLAAVPAGDVKSLALTLAILFARRFALDGLALSFVATHSNWLATLISVMIGFGLVVGLALLAAPTTSLVASFFLDEIAELVEREIDPTGPPRPPRAGDRRRRSTRCASPVSPRWCCWSRWCCCSFPASASSPGSRRTPICLEREYFELAAMRFRPVAAGARDARGMLADGLSRRPHRSPASSRFPAQPVYAAIRHRADGQSA